VLFKYFFWIYFSFFTWSKTLACENIPVNLWTEQLIELWAYSFCWKISYPLSSYHCLAEALFYVQDTSLPLSIRPTNMNWKISHVGHMERWLNDVRNQYPPMTHSALFPMPYFNRKTKSWPFTNRQSGRSMFWNKKCFTSKTLVICLNLSLRILMTDYFAPLFPQTTWEIQCHSQFNDIIIYSFLDRV